MRAFAVIANLIQMLIIITLFLIQGISLGGLTILAFFLLLLIAFLNLLVLLFHTALAAADQAAQRNDKGGLIKRQDLRVRYLGETRPELTVGDRCFSVLDLSENGIRIRIDREQPLKRRFRGRIALVSEKVLNVQVAKVRRQGNEAALMLKQPIDWDILAAEKELATRFMSHRPA